MGGGDGGWCRQLTAFVGRAPTPLSAALCLHMAPVPPVAEAAGLPSVVSGAPCSETTLQTDSHGALGAPGWRVWGAIANGGASRAHM